MALLLAIETSTKNCSVALFYNGNLLQLKESNSDKYLHAENLTLFIEHVIKKAHISFNDLEGIIISKGPGSYTGLRIGISVAKGLCYSLDIPLLSVSTLRAMAFGMSNMGNYKLYCPMIDARRMEVFSSLFDQKNNKVREIRAEIVDSQTYSEFLKDKVVFFGDGAFKCKQVINSPNAHFIKDIYPSAKDLGILGMKKFTNKKFEDVAYFEPYYLKDFVIGPK